MQLENRNSMDLYRVIQKGDNDLFGYIYVYVHQFYWKYQEENMFHIQFKIWQRVQVFYLFSLQKTSAVLELEYSVTFDLRQRTTRKLELSKNFNDFFHRKISDNAKIVIKWERFLELHQI